MGESPEDAAATKPIDIGTGHVCASLDPSSAAWLSIGAVHPHHGFVELSAVPVFDEASRGGPQATRRHRLAMTLGEHAFLAVEIDGSPPDLRLDPADPWIPRWQGARVAVRAAVGAQDATIVQTWSVRAEGRPPSVVLRLRGRIDRPALAEITEVDPPAPTGAVTVTDVSGSVAHLGAEALATTASIEVRGASVAWRREEDDLVGTIAWPAGSQQAAFSVEVSLVLPASVARPPATPACSRADRLVARSLAYIRGCTALRAGEGERAILTDHRILPLSWTRDAYWQALALLAADDGGDRDRVADHLRWLWRRCDRPDGRWVRSHHADGRRKDLAFQADQQLYPIVELADYWRVTGSLPTDVDWNVAVTVAWRAALEAADPSFGLIASTENAADDPADLPYIGASQILLWYAALRLAEMADAGALEVDGDSMHQEARRARDGFDAHFVDGAAPWPYAVDLAGGQVVYHDANDLPIALATLWGFCNATDPGWQATMAFAFSPDNPGWSGGWPPGLGSAHTPGTWTLGEVQAWIRARATGSDAAADAARRRLEAMAFEDGMLPEAIAPGGRRIRHWFAWPGAAMAALLLLDRAGRLETALAASG